MEKPSHAYSHGCGEEGPHPRLIFAQGRAISTRRNWEKAKEKLGCQNGRDRGKVGAELLHNNPTLVVH